jgi:hypothetical protein
VFSQLARLVLPIAQSKAILTKEEFNRKIYHDRKQARQFARRKLNTEICLLMPRQRKKAGFVARKAGILRQLRLLSPAEY